jgi:hypothetical protein
MKFFDYALNELAKSQVDGELSGSGGATIAFYDIDINPIALNSNSCTELGNTGVFVFKLSNFTTTPTSYVVYTYIMSRGPKKFFGTVKIGSQENPASVCQVNFNIFEASGDQLDPNRLYSNKEKIFAEIQGTFHQSSTGIYFYQNQTYPNFNQITGKVYWLLPVGATVKFFISHLNIKEIATIPDLSEVNLHTLLNP